MGRPPTGLFTSQPACLGVQIGLSLNEEFNIDIGDQLNVRGGANMTIFEASVVNASFPAPVTLCTVFPSHEIIQCVWKALAEAAPERVSADWGVFGVRGCLR